MEIGKVVSSEITKEMQKSYLDYAMSVIVSRALPDVRDGLKPVHRRILYAMHLMGLKPTGGYSKSAKVVGEVLGKYHPHSDAAVYDALVRLAQDFSMRYPLIQGQGNFGSVDGDPPAAMRYCVVKNTRVITDKGLEKITDLKKRNPHIKVLSWNNKINTASKWFDSGVHPTKKIKTYRGFTLQGSYNHPVLTWTKNEEGTPLLAWKLLKDIRKGEYCAMNRTSVFFPKNPQLINFHPKLINRRAHHVLPKKMTPDLAFILGAIVAEGNISKKQIGFCNNDPAYLREFKKAFTKTFPDCRLHEFKRKPRGFTQKVYYSLEIHSLHLLEFFRNIGLTISRSGNKEVPEIIFLSSKKSISAFLRGYAEGDGSVYLSGTPEISFISKSEKLLSQMQLLLLRFGIESSNRYQPSKDIYKLLMRNHVNLNLFKNEIDFVSERKRRKLTSISKMNSNGWVMSKTDFVPYISEYLRTFAKEKYWGHTEWLKKHNLDRYSKLKKYWSKIKTILNKKDKKLILNILKNNFLFERVIKVENTGKQKVYSIRVDSDCHSFISNGFISHNTEVRMSKITPLMLLDIAKETVDFTDNFDATLKEPSYLPALLPNLLLMGSEGIAVGMATKIPPHNSGEVIDAIIETIKKGKVIKKESEKVEKEADFVIKKINLVASGEKKKLTEKEIKPENISFESEITTEELTKIIPGPDFPTGGSIYGSSTLSDMYATGKGKILVRGVAEIEEGKRGRNNIIISELPYQVNKANLIKKIADLSREKKIKGISDLRDESDKQGLRVVIELKKDSRPKAILNNLYKHTKLQSSFPANFVALVDGTPHTLNLKQILTEYIRHRQKVVVRRTIFELTEAKRRAHILEGLKIALDNLDAVIKTIRRSRTQEIAKTNLIKKFKLTDIQATAILDMQLRRLAALEREKIEKEYEQVKKLIDKLIFILKTPKKVLDIITKELQEIKEKYSDKRRTKIYKQGISEFSEEDLVPKKDTLITITKTGYVKRVPRETYKSQRRGGKGVVGMTTKEEDEIEHIIDATTHDTILFFTNKGKVYGTKAWDISETTRQAKGQAIVNILDLDPEERVVSVLPMNAKGKHLIIATSNGIVKKTAIKQFKNLRSSGLIAIRLANGDSLVSVKETSGNDHVLLLTRNGKAIRFPEANARPMGRATSGVRGIRLGEEDRVISMEVFFEKQRKPKDKRKKVFRDILTISENGLGKRTAIRNFPVQKRAGKGVKAAVVNKRTGKIVTGTLVTEKSSQLVVTSKKAQVIKLPIKNITQMGRATQGVILMRFAKKDDKVAAITSLEKK